MLSDRAVCPVCLSATLVYCGQTAGWIKMPLGTEVGLSAGHIVLDGLGLGDIVLDGDPAPPRKWAQQPPLFGPLLWHGNRTTIVEFVGYLDCSCPRPFVSRNE